MPPTASPTNRSTRSAVSTLRSTPRTFSPTRAGTSFPDDARLTELAREAGVVGKVPRVHQGRQVHPDGRWVGHGGWHPCHPDGPYQRPGLPVDDTRSLRWQDQRDRRGRARNRLGCDPSGVVTATASAKPDEPLEHSTTGPSVHVGHLIGRRVVGPARGRGGPGRLGHADHRERSSCCSTRRTCRRAISTRSCRAVR